MLNIKVVAFDCDGVMFDTEKANKAFYNRILNHLGMPIMTPEQFSYANMHTAEKVLAYLTTDPERFEAAQAYRKKIGYLPFIPFMEIEPYLKQVLKKLRLKYNIAIATNRTDSIDHALKEFDLGGYFDFVVSALDVKRPNQMIYVGDSELDEIAARAAGTYLVAYNNRNLDADFHINGLQELEEILEV